MKFFRKILLILFLIGVIWGIGKIADVKEAEQTLQTSPALEINLLKFAVMSDVHLDSENFQKALTKAKDNGAEFIIVTGDLTSLGKREELLSMKKVLDEAGLKYYVIPGNHDLWFSEKVKDNFFKEIFGQEYQAFKNQEIKFILINNGSYLGMGETQRIWLESEVQECHRIICLVFMHIPLNHPVSQYVMGEDNPKVASEAGELVKLLVNNKVKEVFAGHLHYSSSYEMDGLKTNIVGAITGARNFQSPKFLEVRLSRGKLTKEEVFVNN